MSAIRWYQMCVGRLLITQPKNVFMQEGVSGQLIGPSRSLWYAGIAMQVLQYLREFDAPAMQSCKPLPCGTGSCQNRRLREQTLTRKPCHCGSIKGGWCMELPTSLDQPLQGQIVCACFDMFLPVWDLYLFPERVSLVTCKSQRHFNNFC